MTNLDSILISRVITLPTKVCIVKGMVSPVIRYGCESWTVKKAECQRIDAFKLWSGEDSWESLGKQGDQTSNPKGNQPWIFIGRTDAEAEAPIFWLPDAKSRLIVKDPDTGKVVGERRRGHQRMRLLDIITNSVVMNLSKLREIVKDRGAWCAAVHGVTKIWMWLSDWTTTNGLSFLFISSG